MGMRCSPWQMGACHVWGEVEEKCVEVVRWHGEVAKLNGEVKECVVEN